MNTFANMKLSKWLPAVQSSNMKSFAMQSFYVLILTSLLFCTTNACSFNDPNCTVTNGSEKRMKCISHPSETVEILLAGQPLIPETSHGRVVSHHQVSFTVSVDLHEQNITCKRTSQDGNILPSDSTIILVEFAPVIASTCQFNTEANKFHVDWNIISNPRVDLDEINNIQLTFRNSHEDNQLLTPTYFPILRNVTSTSVELQHQLNNPFSDSRCTYFIVTMHISTQIGQSTQEVVCTLPERTQRNDSCDCDRKKNKKNKRRNRNNKDRQRDQTTTERI